MVIEMLTDICVIIMFWFTWFLSGLVIPIFYFSYKTKVDTGLINVNILASMVFGPIWGICYILYGMFMIISKILTKLFGKKDD